jgi:hypothetical protein
MRTAVLVEALVEKYGSINAASRGADIPITTLFKLKREEVDVRISTLCIVADALNRPLAEVVEVLQEGRLSRCAAD